MTKNNDIDKYKYSGYGIGFDRKRKFSVGDEFFCTSWQQEKRKPYTGVRWYYINCRKKNSINFTENNKVCLSLRYNGVNSYLFVNGTEIQKFKTNDSEIVANHYIYETFQRLFSR